MAVVLGSNARLAIAGQGEVDRGLWARFVAGAEAHFQRTGQRTQVNSVMRDTAAQTRLWNEYQAYLRRLNGGPWAPWAPTAARPGTSLHEKGLAIDAQPYGAPATWGSPWQAAMQAAGLAFPLRSIDEPWHLELDPTRKPLPTPAPIPQEDIMASLDDLRRVIREEQAKLAEGTLSAVLTAEAREAPLLCYRTPNGSIYLLWPRADGKPGMVRSAPDPAEVKDLLAIGAISSPHRQVDQGTADRLARRYPLA